MPIAVDCPYNGCKGTLELQTFFSTDMGYGGLDENQKIEQFACTACGRKVRREYTWEAHRGTPCITNTCWGDYPMCGSNREQIEQERLDREAEERRVQAANQTHYDPYDEALGPYSYGPSDDKPNGGRDEQ
jgi:hypothetical protein